MSKISSPNFSPENQAFANTIVQQLDALANQRQQWESTDYKKANEGLYDLLAQCLSIYQARFVKGSTQDQKALRSGLIQRLTADRIRVVKTSTTLTMLARFVFNSDRKRAQGYAYVLTAAVSHGVMASDFKAWVTKEGGIEQIKRYMVKSQEALARKAALDTATVAVKSEIEQRALKPLAHVCIEGLSGSYAMLLVKPNPTGMADVVGALDSLDAVLVNALIVRMAKAQVRSTEADAELGKQVTKEHGDLLAANDEQLAMVVNG